MNSEKNNRFYADFEARFRGPRSIIYQRLKCYLPLLEPLREHVQTFSALDLGCGRGEWLELLEAQGASARGIDLDSAQLESCHKRGLKASCNNALDELRALEENSQTLITAFHLAEHLPNEELRHLIQEAHRVLIPGGHLILETPNPDNLCVGSNTFYLDPSHKRPLPAQLLQFLVQHGSFQDAHILRLQHDQDLSQRKSILLRDVLQGVSPDYAVVAIKGGVPHLSETLKSSAKAFGGTTLNDLCHRFDQQQQQLDQQQQQLDQRQLRLFDEHNQLKARLKQLERQHEDFQAELKQERFNLQMVLKSRSWRLTKPLRVIIDLLKR
ncbi:methyltransferase domain protein [Synechococcus sp. BIOS-U3-1]|nr:methyltransferase domain protein [Synechococcus sp. BIOS-U3-1]